MSSNKTASTMQLKNLLDTPLEDFSLSSSDSIEISNRPTAFVIKNAKVQFEPKTYPSKPDLYVMTISLTTPTSKKLYDIRKYLGLKQQEPKNENGGINWKYYQLTIKFRKNDLKKMYDTEGNQFPDNYNIPSLVKKHIDLAINLKSYQGYMYTVLKQMKLITKEEEIEVEVEEEEEFKELML
jgi:hypothetical protein